MKDSQLIFLSHSSKDKSIARSLYRRLTSDGYSVWFDEESLIAGQNWELEINKAISQSDVVIVCLSKNAMTKDGYLHREIRIALDIAYEKPEGKIFLIPIKLDECDVPTRLTHLHWVNLYEDNGYTNLCKALDVHSEKSFQSYQEQDLVNNLGNSKQLRKKKKYRSSFWNVGKKLIISVILAIVSLISGTVIGFRMISPKPINCEKSYQTVYVSSQNISRGDVIEENDLVSIEIVSDYVIDSYITEMNSIIGKNALVNITQYDILVRRMFSQ